MFIDATIHNPTNRQQRYNWASPPLTVKRRDTVSARLKGDPRKDHRADALNRDLRSKRVRVWVGGKALAPSKPVVRPSGGFVQPVDNIPRNPDGSLRPWRERIDSPPSIVEDTALVLCHFGIGELRLKATYDAMGWTVQANPRPRRIVMVEAVKGREESGMRAWCGENDIDYIRRPVPKDGEGIFIKEALWTIGAHDALKDPGIAKLIFLDADCTFVHQDWARHTADSLDRHDVVSPHWKYYYANQPEPAMRSPWESIGYSWQTKGGTAHPGLTVAMRKGYFLDQLDGRLVNLSKGSGDVYLWTQILGNWCISKMEYPGYMYTPMERTPRMPMARVGHAGQIAVHHYHGPMNNRGYRARHVIGRACLAVHGDEIEYNRDGMPVWRDSIEAHLSRDAMARVLREGGDKGLSTTRVRDLYDEMAREVYGAFTEDNPLVITCLLRGGGEYGPRHVHWLKEQFDNHCRAPFRFVCQADMEVPGVETIPLVTSKHETPTWWAQVEHYRNIWGDSSVLTCDLDTVIMRDFTPCQCPPGRFHMLREANNWARNANVVWGGGLTYFRGDFGRVFDQYREDFAAGGARRPDYASFYSQDWIVGALRSINVYPRDIYSHFCYLYYQGDNKRVAPEAHFAIFPARPKPWDMDPSSPVLPPSLPELG